MKRCPECRRDYHDDSLLYCLEDGVALIQGSVPSPDEPTTAILHEGSTASEAATKAQINTTEQTSTLTPGVADVRRIRSFNTKILLAPLIIAVIVLGGFFAYRYFDSRNNQIGSIAVMPFVNDSGNPDVEYLSEGMTETLINGLSQVPGLSVKARSSVFRYKSKDVDSRTIAKELGVAALLNGHLTERGDMVSLSIELIDGQTENVLWGNRYERKLSELVQFQSEVAHDVSSRLKSRLSTSEEARVTKSYTSDPRALDLYLKGRYLSRRFTLDGFVRGVDAFNQAIAIDPNYALAYAGLSDAYFYASTIHLPPTEALPKVGEFAKKALELDDSLPAAHHSAANYKANYERDNEGAKLEFESALKLDPNDSSIYYDYSQLLANIGESENAIAIARQGKLVDPQDSGISYTLAQALILAGHYDEGLAETENTIRLDNNNWWGYYWRGIALSEKGSNNDAVAALQTAAGLDDSPLIRGVLAGALARAGRRADAQKVIDELIIASKNKFVSQTSIAMGFVGLGDLDNAFAWLGKALESHDEQIVWIYKHPMFTGLRNDARYKDMLRKIWPNFI